LGIILQIVKRRSSEMKRFNVLVSLATVLCAVPLSADDDAPDRFIEVTGIGVVTQSPDQAEVSFAVESQAETARQANRSNAERTRQLIKAIKSRGIDANDLRTSEYSVNPRYADRRRDDRDLKPIGYVVNNTVRVTVRKLEDVGGLIDAAVSSGASRVNNIRFELSSPEKARNRALELAMAQTKLEADLILSQTPHKVGRVMTIRTRGGHSAPKIERAVMSMARMDTPIEAGTLNTRAEVVVTYEITD
jgi:uncharacterized protein YggE